MWKRQKFDLAVHLKMIKENWKSYELGSVARLTADNCDMNKPADRNTPSTW